MGLAREVEYDLYVTSEKGKGASPIRWTALEALKFQNFSRESDIWSFGVLMWEIFSGGVVPYHFLDQNRISNYIENGDRLPRPKECPIEIYHIMLRCWELDRNKR